MRWRLSIVVYGAPRRDGWDGYDEDDEGRLLVGCRDGWDNGYDEDGWENGRETGGWSVVAELIAARRIYGRLYVLMVDTDGFADC